MNIRVLEAVSDLKLICNNNPNGVIETGYTSDLLSDVLANCEDDAALISIQAHKNTIAVASISGVSAVIICNDRPIPDDMVEAAEEAEIALFKTDLNQYETSLLLGKLLESN